MKFLTDEPRYLPHGWAVFGVYFSSQSLFEEQYRMIQPEKSKDLFLRVVTIYRHMVKDGDFMVNHEGKQVHGIYFDVTYKFITIMSLIEALYEEDKYMDFYSWLNQSAKDDQYPIESRDELRAHFDEYRERHGAANKARRFFNSLSPDWHWILTEGIRAFRYKVGDESGEVEEIKLSVDDIVNYLYQIRSDFVHSAEVVHQLDRGFGLSTKGNRRYMNRLSVDDLAYIFEAGLLSHFNFEPDYPMGNEDQLKLLYPNA
jgi:hypothetical protein